MLVLRTGADDLVLGWRACAWSCARGMHGRDGRVTCTRGTFGAHVGMCWPGAVVQAGRSAAQICARGGDKLRRSGDGRRSLASDTRGKVCRGIAPSCRKMPRGLEAGLQACWAVEQHLTTRGADGFVEGRQDSHGWRRDRARASRLSRRECSRVGRILRAVGVGAAARRGRWKDALDDL